MDKKYLRDVAERVVATFAQSFLAAYTVTGGRKAAEAAAIAGLSAVLAFLKGLAAKRIGNPDSASAIPGV